MVLLEFFFSFLFFFKLILFNLWRLAARWRGLKSVRKNNWESDRVQVEQSVHLPRGGRQWFSVIQRHSFEIVILLLILAGTKHFPEIILLFVALAGYCFSAILKASTGEARDMGRKPWWLVKRISKPLPKWEWVSCYGSLPCIPSSSCFHHWFRGASWEGLLLEDTWLVDSKGCFYLEVPKRSFCFGA